MHLVHQTMLVQKLDNWCNRDCWCHSQIHARDYTSWDYGPVVGGGLDTRGEFAHCLLCFVLCDLVFASEGADRAVRAVQCQPGAH